MDIATDPDFLMAVGDGHGIVIRPVAHQGQRVDPRALLVARVERCRQWPLQRFAVTHKPFADALAVAAQDVALPVAALLAMSLSLLKFVGQASLVDDAMLPS